MSEQDALKVLETVTANLQLNRKDHQTILTALAVLAKAIQTEEK